MIGGLRLFCKEQPIPLFFLPVKKRYFMLTKKDLLGLKDCSAEEIYEILDEAEKMKKLLN